MEARLTLWIVFVLLDTHRDRTQLDCSMTWLQGSDNIQNTVAVFIQMIDAKLTKTRCDGEHEMQNGLECCREMD